MVTQSYRVSPDAYHVDQALSIHHHLIDDSPDSLGMQCDYWPSHRANDPSGHTQLLTLGNRLYRVIADGMVHFSNRQWHLAT